MFLKVFDFALQQATHFYFTSSNSTLASQQLRSASENYPESRTAHTIGQRVFNFRPSIASHAPA